MVYCKIAHFVDKADEVCGGHIGIELAHLVQDNNDILHRYRIEPRLLFFLVMTIIDLGIDIYAVFIHF
jgi:hypothetical protein